MQIHRHPFLRVCLAAMTYFAYSCEKENSLVVNTPAETQIDPLLLSAIELRDNFFQTNQANISHNTPLDEKAYMQQWQEIDPDSKRATLKLWSYVMATKMGFSEEDIIKDINEEISDLKIEETWNEAIQFQFSEYRKRIKTLQKEFSSPQDQELIKELPTKLFRHEGPFLKNNRAYSLIYYSPEKNDSYSRLLTLHPIVFEEYRRQTDGSWKRVDWPTWDKITRAQSIPSSFTTKLDKPHISEQDIEAFSSSFQSALKTWQSLIEHPEKIDPSSFIKHCDPNMLESCKKWFIEYYQYSSLCGDSSVYEHLFTWSDIYQTKLKKIDTIDFWNAYLKYCKSHIEGDFFDEEDDYTYSDFRLSINPKARHDTLYERYLKRGQSTNIFVLPIVSAPVYLQIYDLVPIDNNTLYVIYRRRHEHSVFRGLNREKFVRVNGKWKFRFSVMNNRLKFQALDQKERYEKEQQDSK